MTTTAFQYVFDNAETFSINTRPVVAQTISRNFTVRTVVRSAAKKKFTVNLPNGMAWDLAKPYIEAIMAAGQYTPGTVTISPSTYGTWFEPTETNTFTLICVTLPEWQVFARNQVSWSGPFIFYEY